MWGEQKTVEKEEEEEGKLAQKEFTNCFSIVKKIPMMAKKRN